MRGLGNPVAFHLTAGRRGDVPQAAALIDGLPAQVVLTDGGTTQHTSVRSSPTGAPTISEQDTAVIPNTPQRASRYPFDKHL